MKTATEKQINEWKAKYGRVFALPVGEKIAYLKAPNMVDYKIAFKALEQGEIAFIETLLKQLFIGGDESIKTDDAYFLSIKKDLMAVSQYEDAVIEKVDNGSKITIGDVSCTVRVITREDLKIAERKNPSGKPFVTQEQLFERIVLEKDEAFNDRNNAEVRMPLYKAIEDLQKQKVGFLKEL